MKTFAPRAVAVAAAAFAATVAATFPAPALAADKPHAHHGAASAAPATHALADGIVKKVDKAGGKLTVAHGPLPGGMPAMTMAFRVKNPGWLDGMQEGQKIRFSVDDVAGALTIVRLETAK